jgi:hypothetical protein
VQDLQIMLATLLPPFDKHSLMTVMECPVIYGTRSMDDKPRFTEYTCVCGRVVGVRCADG